MEDRLGKHFAMVGIVVVGHGRLAEEMVRTVEGVLGPLDGLASVATSYSDSPEEIRARIANAVRRVDRGAGTIIVTDMLGDTPTNLSIAVARELGAEVVAGVNMPILVKLSTARGEMDARSLARFIQRYGQEHIFWATAPRSSLRRHEHADGRRDH
jgi:PTS system mannose-specific IIA component